MKLYYSPGACSLSPHIVARECGQRIDLVKVDLGTKRTEKGEDYRKVNPHGYVPALELDNGTVLTEGPAIVQYIADKAPGSGVVPAAGTIERYKQLAWLNHITSELHKSMGALFNERMAAQAGDLIKLNIAARLATLDKHLAGKDYIMGKQFTAADAYAFTVLGWGKYVGVDVEKYPNIKAFMARVASRPKVQEALKAEGLV
jgi:glutathione S-transferase